MARKPLNIRAEGSGVISPICVASSRNDTTEKVRYRKPFLAPMDLQKAGSIAQVIPSGSFSPTAYIHLIFSERKLKEQVEEKVATRNMFYNEAGRHVRTKKEILGADGKVRPGCCIVPKGMVYEISGFQAKEALFKKKSFTDEVRGFYTGLINQLVPEEERLMVFPRGGSYLATKKIGKNNPKEEEIRKTNALRQEWNAAVSEALSRGVPTGDLIQMKKELIVEPVATSIRKNGKDPELFIRILRKAIMLLIEKARTFRPSVLASLERMKEKAKQQNTKRNERAPEGKILERLSRRMSTPGR